MTLSFSTFCSVFKVIVGNSSRENCNKVHFAGLAVMELSVIIANGRHQGSNLMQYKQYNINKY